MDPTMSRYKDLGPLQELLLTACEPDERGRTSIPMLARSLNISHQYIYRWIEDNAVPPKFVSKLIAMSNGRVTLEQFHPYVF